MFKIKMGAEVFSLTFKIQYDVGNLNDDMIVVNGYLLHSSLRNKPRSFQNGFSISLSTSKPFLRPEKSRSVLDFSGKTRTYILKRNLSGVIFKK